MSHLESRRSGFQSRRGANPYARFLAVAVLLGIGACTLKPREEAPPYVDLQEVDTLVTTESGTLSIPADIVVAGDGSIFVLDYGGPHILQLDPEAQSIIHRIGRPGAGPGELRTPLGLAIRGDTIVTTNAGNGRFERFLIDGSVLPGRPAPPGALLGRLSLNSDGGFILPTNGADSTLARLYGPDGQAAHGVGQAMLPFDPIFRLGAYRNAAIRGEVPDYFRNGVIAAIADDSVVWLAMNTEPAIERFDARGNSLGRTTLSSPVFATIRQWYIDRNRNDSTGSRVYPLVNFADLKPEGARMWVLLTGPPDTPAMVVRLGRSGAVERWFRIAGVTSAWRLAVRPTAQDLLLSSAESGSLFRVRISSEDWRAIR